VAFNQVLAQECAQYSRCRWDSWAVYNYRFSASQVSTLDFPSQPERPGGPGPGRLGRLLVAQHLTRHTPRCSAWAQVLEQSTVLHQMLTRSRDGTRSWEAACRTFK
jgi:hypothetical protein